MSNEPGPSRAAANNGEVGHRDHHGGHRHFHGPNWDSRQTDVRYLTAALALIAAFMAAEVIVAFAAGSVALFADAGHMLIDVGALGASIWAARLASRPASVSMTYGLKRAEVLSAAVNGIVLLVVAVVVGVEAIRRLIHPVGVTGAALVIVAAVGVVVNLVATGVLARANRTSLNIAGAFAHVRTDLWAFVGTFVAGVIVIVTGWNRADPLASLVIVALMVQAAVALLGDSGRVLLEGTPKGVDLAEVRAHILELPEVETVHDLHAWVVTSDLPAVSAHVVVRDDCFANGLAPQVLDRLQACLAGHFDVEHSTFQLEPVGHVDHESPQHD
jgi:cobalt-zinc-cadmium efflux system protein